MNQVIRIIFDDPVRREDMTLLIEQLEKTLGNIAAIEVYEQEFKDEDENGQEQREKESK